MHFICSDPFLRGEESDCTAGTTRQWVNLAPKICRHEWQSLQYDSEVHHQTPRIGSHCFVNSTFECCRFPTIDLCKINPFHLRKKKTLGDFLFWGSHLHIAIKVKLLFILLFSEQLFIVSYWFRTRRHFTLFTIYLTPGKWYISFVVFNVLPQW